jgi:ferredoxin
MTHIITSLCLRDSSCVDVCPVECIVPGKPVDEWPWYYIDPDTCIDCGACIPECPFEAIFTEEEVPSAYAAKGGEVVSMPQGTAGFDQSYDGENEHGEPVHLNFTRKLEAGEVIDLTPDIKPNYDYFTEGMGYKALE